MLIRPFDPQRDRPACHRIWRECGWIKAGEEANMDLYLDASRCLVAEIRGEAECLVMAASGSMRHGETDLSLSAITGVTTSYVARKQGLAARMLARLVAEEAQAGAMVSGLSMFEQGFYDQLGYGTTSYIHRISFDPASLQVKVNPRIPERLNRDDWEAMHANRLVRMRGHGACSLDAPMLTRADIAWDNHFGLGYRDETGALTHHVMMNTSDVESGPYIVSWLVYRNLGELMELLALIRNLGDQVRMVRLEEPPDIVFQDLIRQPFKHGQMTDKGKFAAGVRTAAPYQFRICDMARCLARTRIPRGEARFNLVLSDPIVAYLPEDISWRGVGGDYRVTLGPESSAQPGTDPALPTLRTSVGAFTRLWLGARKASALVVTDDLCGPEALIRELDDLLRLPTPVPGWDF
jgi:hypothetical protein